MRHLPFAVLLSAPPLFIAAIGVLAGTLAPRLRSRAGQVDSVRADVDRLRANLGRILVIAIGGLGGLSIVVAASQVLAL